MLFVKQCSVRHCYFLSRSTHSRWHPALKNPRSTAYFPKSPQMFQDVTSKILTAVTITITVFWYVTSCSLVNMYKRSGRNTPHSGYRSWTNVLQCRNDDGDRMSLRNVSTILPEVMYIMWREAHGAYGRPILKKSNVARRVGKPNILTEIIRKLPQFSRQISGQFPKPGRDHFLQHPLQCFIAPSFDAMRY
jgi:hypothetical protein